MTAGISPLQASLNWTVPHGRFGGPSDDYSGSGCFPNEAGPGVLSVVGFNHITADLEQRSRFGLTLARRDSLSFRATTAGIQECLFLSTCNRAEIYTVGVEPDNVVQLLADEAGLPQGLIRPHLYAMSGVRAAFHMFRVAGGLDSAVLGESEILAQLKEAFAYSESVGQTGTVLHLAFQKALSASKRVRTETDLCHGVSSVGSMAVREARRSVEDWTATTVTILGAGSVAERLARELQSLRPRKVIVTNRTLGKAQALATLHGFEARAIDQLERSISESDVLFSAVFSREPVIRSSMLRDRQLPLTVVDLSVPRSFEESVFGLQKVKTVDMDEISAVCAAGSSLRKESVQAALDILDEEILKYAEILDQRRAAPLIDRLTVEAERLREANLAWAMDRLGDLKDTQKQVVADLTRRIVKGLLTRPIQELKGDLGGAPERAIVAQLFGIEGESDT